MVHMKKPDGTKDRWRCEMRKSKVLNKMRNGEVAISVKLNLADARGAEIAAMSGYDCIWIDMEHTPTDNDVVEHIVRAAKMYDCDVLTRVSKGGYGDYIHPLESDSTGIMVPHLMSLEEAKEIVYYTKFHPVGRRPLDGGNADGKFGMLEPLKYMELANKERFVIVQIEDPEPLAELDEICALEGIDMIFFGPADFSQGIGVPCQFDDARIGETRRLIAETARKHGKFAGTTGNSTNIAEYAAMGYQFINVTSDVNVLAEKYTEVFKKSKKALRPVVAVSDVIRGEGPEFNYFAWPSIARTKDNRIIVGASGFRRRHICPYGKAVIIESDDEGKTYGPIRTVIDTCLDDRDCGLLSFGDSGLIVTSFNNSVAFQQEYAQKLKDEEQKHMFLSHLAAITPEEEKRDIGATFRISYDNGRTFGELHKSPVRNPHGPMELQNGEILWCGTEFSAMDSYSVDKGIQCYQLDPTSGNMIKRGEIPAIYDGEDQLISTEPYMIELPSGKLICHIRGEGEKKDFKQFTLFQSVSNDCGRTWSMPQQIIEHRGGAPAHLLYHSSGALVSVYGYRQSPYEIRAIISYDEGESWKNPIVLYDTGGGSGDIGYPMSIEADNGEIITVFYSRENKYTPAVIKQVRWKIV